MVAPGARRRLHNLCTHTASRLFDNSTASAGARPAAAEAAAAGCDDHDFVSELDGSTQRYVVIHPPGASSAAAVEPPPGPSTSDVMLALHGHVVSR